VALSLLVTGFRYSLIKPLGQMVKASYVNYKSELNGLVKPADGPVRW